MNFIFIPYCEQVSIKSSSCSTPANALALKNEIGFSRILNRVMIWFGLVYLLRLFFTSSAPILSILSISFRTERRFPISTLSII